MSALDIDRELAVDRIRSFVDVPRGTLDLLDRFVALLLEASARQNLVASSTIETLWSRHILDSAQLLKFVSKRGLDWLDIGAGAGLPGIPVAILGGHHVTLVEPRRLRTDFLSNVVTELGLESRIKVICAKVERLPQRPYDVISARAVASLDKLLALGEPFASSGTTWLLPKGRSARDELESVTRSWQAAFELVPSETDAEAAIIVAREVRRKRA